MASNSNSSVPEALNKFKYEVANEIGDTMEIFLQEMPEELVETWLRK